MIEIAVEPKTKADQEKMGEALGRLAKEDPSFRVTSDEESGQTIIKGMGELHLDIIVDRMKKNLKWRQILEHHKLLIEKQFLDLLRLLIYIKNKVVVQDNLPRLH